MRRSLGLVAALAVAAAAPAAAKRSPVLAVTHGSQGMSTLAWVDPVTLRPVADGTLAHGRATWPVTRSPGGRYLLAVDGGPSRTLLRVVDLQARLSTRMLEIRGATGAHAAWIRPDRIIAVTIRNGQAHERLVLAPHPLRVISRAPLTGSALGSRRAREAIVVLLGPTRRIGQLRLVVADAGGRARTIDLEGMNGGWEGRATPDGYVSRHASPGLAVEPGGRRVAVVGADRYALVELPELRVTVRALTGRQVQKRAEGWWREAVWASGDRVAVAGVEHARERPSPAGATLLNVATGEARTLDATASAVARRGSTLFTWGAGLGCYERDGSLRYRVDDVSIGDVSFAYGFVYVNDSRDRTRFRVFDATTGRLLGRARTSRPTTVVGPA